MVTPYPMEELRNHIEEVRIRVGKPDAAGRQVLSVTNVDGLTKSDRRTSNDLSNYLCVEERFFAYNPYRINVGSIGLARGRNQVGVVSPAYVVFRTKSTLLPEYLLFLLRSPDGLSQIRRLTSGSVRQTLRFAALCRFRLPVPPLPVQRHIVAVLEWTDELRRKRAKADRLTDQILPALFAKMFGHPATNPMGWPVVRLGAVITSSQYGTSRASNTQEIGLPLLRMNNITYEGFLDLSDLKYVELNETEIERYHLEPGDLLFNRTNSRQLVGKTAIFRGELDCVAASYLIRVRVNEERVRPEYVWGFLNSRHGKRILFNTARQSVSQANINAQELASLELPLPPVAKQVQYVEATENIAEILRQQQSDTRTTLNVLFQVQLTRAFRGELEIALPIEEIFIGITDRQRVLLTLVGQAAEVQQPMHITPLMKYAFLLREEGWSGLSEEQLALPLAAEARAAYLPVEWYEFAPYKYGPFAKDLYEDLEALERAGLITLSHPPKSKGALREKMEIYLVQDQADIVRDLADSLPAEVRRAVEAIIEEYGSLNQKQLLDLVYQQYPEYTVNAERKKGTSP